MERLFLCQAGPGVSCGACCGLYNVPDPSPKALSGLLESRTRAFARVARDVDDIRAFGQEETARREPGPMPDFHHCPFLGLVGDPPDRPGCMLHPLAPGNGGADFRDLCHWGGMACRMYACPTHGLAPGISRVLARACGEWRLYGLMVPETDMLRVFLSLAGEPEPAAILKSDPALEAVARLAGFRQSWPFRDPEKDPLAAYFFNDGLYPRPATHYPSLGRPPSPLEPILRALGTRFATGQDLDHAQDLIGSCILDLARATGCRPAL